MTGKRKPVTDEIEIYFRRETDLRQRFLKGALPPGQVLNSLQNIIEGRFGQNGNLLAPSQAPIDVEMPLAELETLFDTQLQRLVGLGYHLLADIDEKEFRNRLAPLRAKLNEVGPVQTGDGRLPFVIVIPHGMVSISAQVAKIEHNGLSGKNYLGESGITYFVSVPSGNQPFLAVDVEDGRGMLGKSPNACQKQFKQEGRLGLIVEGGIAVEHQSHVLSHHYMDLPGSRCDEDWVPGLHLYGDRPALVSNYPGSSVRRWGSASCGRYIGV